VGSGSARAFPFFFDFLAGGAGEDVEVSTTQDDCRGRFLADTCGNLDVGADGDGESVEERRPVSSDSTLCRDGPIPGDDGADGADAAADGDDDVSVASGSYDTDDSLVQ
jgi:hypothetical protein